MGGGNYCGSYNNRCSVGSSNGGGGGGGSSLGE